jgi:hypothetical protein
MNKPSLGLRGIALAAAVAALPSISSAEGPKPPPAIKVVPNMPVPQVDGATRAVFLDAAASYAWSAFIALNWPASLAPNVRGTPATDQPFGQPDSTPVWVTMRSKVEVFPGNANAGVGPHGAMIDPNTHHATNPPDYGYGQAPDYLYQAKAGSAGDGHILPCIGQPPATTPAWIALDETTQINNNQTFAGAAPVTDPANSKPRLIRYAVKMNEPIYASVVAGQYWYSGGPLKQAKQNFVTALADPNKPNPVTPFVNYAPPGGAGPDKFGIETKTSWRPLTDKEATSGRFFVTRVRYYEQDAKGISCYHEASWGLVGMHVISFSPAAPPGSSGRPSNKPTTS